MIDCVSHLGSLLRFQVLFGAMAITVSENYEKELNFTYPISVQSYNMLIPRPKELSRLYLFIAPFTMDVSFYRTRPMQRSSKYSLKFSPPSCPPGIPQTWFALSVTIALIGPLFYVVHFLSPYHEHHHIAKKGGLFKVQNCFWYMYGALLQQGGMYLPKSDSGRIIIATWWLVVLVVVTTYCGNLVAFLTFPKMEIPVSTVGELVSGKYPFTWSIRANTFLDAFVKETDIDKFVRLNESAEYHDSIGNETMSRVRAGKHIVIDWETNLLHVMRKEYLQTDRCEFTLSTEKFLSEKIGLVLPGNSPYLNIFDEEIYRMQQMGFIHKWLNEYLPKKDRCSGNAASAEIENHTVNLTDMQGCFLVLIAGAVEYFCYYLSHFSLGPSVKQLIRFHSQA